jgi:predicted DCC family thiol-disulfide oxidoreductase YuxK
MMSVASPHPDPLPEGEGTLYGSLPQGEGTLYGPILFYDGVCAFCNNAVQFILRHDAAGRFRFAALQSEYARRVLGRHGRDARDLDTLYLLLDAGTPRERLLAKSDAVVAILQELGGAWKMLALARLLPRSVRDRAYGVLVRHRYAWFGRYDQCPLPPPRVRERFIDSH